MNVQAWKPPFQVLPFECLDLRSLRVDPVVDTEIERLFGRRDLAAFGERYREIADTRPRGLEGEPPGNGALSSYELDE
jgi:hypothetical protein